MLHDDSLHHDEEDLRRQIRAEIAERDRLRQKADHQRETEKSASVEAEKRRRIYQEELKKYYQDRPGYRQIVRDDGEVDWVPEAEVRHNAKLFDEVLEDPDTARSRMKWVLSLSGLVVLIVIVVMYLVLHERTGSIQVTSNVPGAQVILDDVRLDQFTDITVKEIPAGKHVVTVNLKGYKVQGESVRQIQLRGGQLEPLSFILLPDSITGDSSLIGQP